MKRSAYKKLVQARNIFLMLAMVLTTTKLFSQTTYTFYYTGNVQTLTLQAGTFDVKMWGADGGNSGNSRCGIGGYSNGTLTLPSTTTLYIVVGGSPLYTGSTGLQPGGYNGGGSGYANSTGRAGGGATHIATVTGVLSSLSSNTAAVIMVAGGGGGDQNAGSIGHGGGLSGGGTYPGSQTGSSGGIFGSFGQGGNITSSYGGGGGGGWYGGGGNQNNAGSGGSGYIGGVSNGVTSMSATTGFVTRPTSSADGLVIITELCNLNLYAAGATNSIAPVLCSGQTVTLMTNGIGNYQWSTGATSSSIVIAPTTNTVYTLTATGPANCTAGRTISVTVSSGLPVLSISNPSSNICLGKAITLTASGALTYTWTNPGVVNGQTFAPISTAVYTVSGQNGCGIVTATTGVTVAPLAIAATANPQLVCSGSASTLTAVSAVSNYTWYPAGNNGSMTIVAPSANSVYTVAATDGTCFGTQTVAVNTKPIPVVQINGGGSPVTICQGDQVIITATGGNTYTWSPGNLSGPTITVSPGASTVYVATGENTVNCFASAQQIVLVNPSPTINISASDMLVCPGQSVSLTATGANTYSWSGGPNTDTYVINPSTTTAYTVTGGQTSNTCTGVAQITISVLAPSLTLPTNTAICSGSSATLHASGADDYSWNSIPTGNNGTYVVTPPATTTITLVATSQSLSTSCSTTHTFVVTVNPLPTLTVAATRTAICKGETNTLTATGAQSYSWTGTNTGSVIVITPTAAGIYTVLGKDANGCMNTGSYQVRVNTCNGIAENGSATVWLNVYPNPNNGTFNVTSTAAIKLVVTNQLGQQLRHVDLNEGNGYKMEVGELTPGIYFVSDLDKGTAVFKIVVN